MDKATRLHSIKALAFALLAVVSLASAPAAATVYEVGSDGMVRLAGERGSDASDSADTGQAGPLAPEPAPEVPAIAMTMIDEPAVPPDYRVPLLNASTRYGVSPKLLAALARQESAWRASAVSPKGAVGLTQLMPATARALAVDPRDPSANLDGGARYLRQLLDQFDGNIERALAAYNAGPNRVIRAGGVPAISETRAYVASIVDRLGAPSESNGRR